MQEDDVCSTLVDMQKSLSLYEDLKEAFRYLCSSWLRYSPNQSTLDEAHVILAAGSFLFDNLFVKENAGGSITTAAAKDLGPAFRARALNEAATRIRLGMSEEDIRKGGTQLRDYMKWVAEEHPVIYDSLKDHYGLLVVAIAEEISALILSQNQDNKDMVPLETAELTLLNFAQIFFLVYKENFGPAFLRNPSAPFFLDVENEMERINKEITD